MITSFLNFLSQNNVDYRITNGYEAIFDSIETDSDYDILLKKTDFNAIESTIDAFCRQSNFKLVQTYHQAVLAKNIFIYNKETDTLLNLDFYGEIARQEIKILEEKTVFSSNELYRGLKILSPEQEFIQYFIKKIDKGELTKSVFDYLKNLYQDNSEQCNLQVKKFFKQTHVAIQNSFLNNNYSFIKENITRLKEEFKTAPKTVFPFTINNILRVINRIVTPTGIAIAFLGPDGSGKSTIIDGLLKEELPFRRNDYFHLKPILKKETKQQTVTNPHAKPPYSFFVSGFKLLFFLIQFNLGWIKNILHLKIRSSLVIFDRYYDDLLADPKRYRLSFTGKFAKGINFFIPKPDIFFILSADAETIHNRKQEVPLEELKQQLTNYYQLGNNKRYINVDVGRKPEEIILEIKQILMKKMNERY